MKKTTRCVGAVVAGLVMLSLAAPAPAADPAGFETYVVRPGDTLSSIAGRIFGDAKRWREILTENPQVTNPNRIYPGDALLVPVPQTAAPPAGYGGELAASAGVEATVVAGPDSPEEAPGSGASTDQAAAVPEEAPAVEPVAESPPVQLVAVVNPALYRSAGSITERLPQVAIVAAEDEREMLATGDAAVINAAISPGARFTVVRADRRVFHPTTGAYLGWLVRVLGTAEVTCGGETTSTVMLSGMRLPAGIGDYLAPFNPDDRLEENALAGKIKPECIAAGASDAVVVAFDEDQEVGSERDLAYIDRGSAGGVAPGRRFLIYREIAQGGRVTVGELQVLRVGERTATALITSSVQEVRLGDLLRVR